MAAHVILHYRLKVIALTFHVLRTFSCEIWTRFDSKRLRPSHVHPARRFLFFASKLKHPNKWGIKHLGLLLKARNERSEKKKNSPTNSNAVEQDILYTSRTSIVIEIVKREKKKNTWLAISLAVACDPVRSLRQRFAELNTYDFLAKVFPPLSIDFYEKLSGCKDLCIHRHRLGKCWTSCLDCSYFQQSWIAWNHFDDVD